MAEQLSLFGSPEPELAPVKHARAAKQAKPDPAPEPIAAYASVVLDIPTRALSEPFAYGIPRSLANEAQIGSTVLVHFGNRAAAGYIVDIASGLGELQGNNALDPSRVKPIETILSKPLFGVEAARIARWMSREYVATLSECLRLFLPPGGSPRVVKGDDGAWTVERPAVKPIQNRWVMLTPEGFDYTPPKTAVRQRQLIEALQCGPVTTRDLNLLYNSMSATIKALEKRGVVVVEERRAWRGCSEQTTLSSASGKAPVALTNGQQQALAQIERARLDAHGDVVLVDGVTGSGKTEVYLSAIERVLEAGRSACVLVPEISLTAQTVGRFRSRFGETVAVFHSRLSAGERLDQWDLVASGVARVVVGARSALFCPLSDLGLIIIDEEHETSYKQGSSPRYHAREVAAEMARRYRCPLVLGSATPSAEALDRCRRGTFNGVTWTRVEMPERPGHAVLPEVRIADLRREFSHGSRSMFSKPLMEGLERVVERRGKAVLLHNRRGFAPFLMCRECGCVPTCNHCSTALTYHERTHTLQCHTCGSSWRVQPYPAPTSRCPKCGSRYLAKMGLGTQQIEDALHQMLPDDVAIIRMDADSTRGKDAHKKLLEQFDAADCAVLLGTQMIAKGLDFPEVTLVGVVNADFALKLPDFRSGERAYDLLEQVAGRAGRGDRPGEVIIQTYLPEDPVIRAVAEHDRSIFTDYDLDQRRDALYPPFVRLVNILVWSANRDDAQDYIGRFARLLKRRWHAAAPDFLRAGSSVPQVLGPASCVIERAKDRYRFHLLVKSPVGYHVSDDIDACLKEVGSVRGVSVSVDVDAYDLM